MHACTFTIHTQAHTHTNEHAHREVLKKCALIKHPHYMQEGIPAGAVHSFFFSSFFRHLANKIAAGCHYNLNMYMSDSIRSIGFRDTNCALNVPLSQSGCRARSQIAMGGIIKACKVADRTPLWHQSSLVVHLRHLLPHQFYRVNPDHGVSEAFVRIVAKVHRNSCVSRSPCRWSLIPRLPFLSVCA